jgi:hypothetical protein
MGALPRLSNLIPFSRRPLAPRPRQPVPHSGFCAGRYPVLPRDSAALSLRCDVPPRSQLSRRVRAGLSIRVLRRCEFGDYPVQDGSDAFHSNNYGASNGRDAGKSCREYGNG